MTSTSTSPHTEARPRPRRRRQGLSDQAATTAIDQACRALRLPTVRTSVEDMVTAAEHEQLS